jgi:hypothetical protein
MLNAISNVQSFIGVHAYPIHRDPEYLGVGFGITHVPRTYNDRKIVVEAIRAGY